MQLHETPSAKYEYDGNGLLIITFADDVEFDVRDIEEQRAIAFSFHHGKPHVVLGIAGQRTSATKEALQYASVTIPEGRVAEALMIRSLPVRLMGNFYLQFHKPALLTKMFDDRDEAVRWLRERLALAGR